ncbi:GldG family protein [Oceanispirochaeta crateris]|nr:GldG family protein [Oceanispirochaeta crateris]
MMNKILQIFRLRERQIFIILLILVVILINLISHRAVDLYPLKLDLTENALYEFSQTTVDMAASLTNPVRMVVFSKEDDYVVMLREVLKRFAALSPLISLEYVDPYENPVLVDYYASRGIQLKPDDIVLEGALRTRSFSVKDMYSFDAGQTQVTGLNAEQQLTSSLSFINDPIIPVAAFSDGHNERPSESLTALFQNNNYDLLRGSLSSILQEDPDILVVAAPSRDFLVHEVELLTDYMNSGGNALIFLEPSSLSMPHLEGFLTEWGIVPGEELVFEKEAYTGGNPVNVVPMYAPHKINSYFLDARVFLTMPSSRSLYSVSHPGSAIDVRDVLTSTPFSYGKKGYQFSDLLKEDSDPAGPFTLVMSSEKELSGEAARARLVVAGSRNIYGDDLLGFSSYGNAEFLVQTINWLNEKDVSLYIPPKKMQSDPLNLQSRQALLLALIVTAYIPMVFLVWGITVFFKRKRL